VSAAVVIERCRALARHTETAGTITRTFLSEPMRGVHADVSAWMTAAGLRTSIDAAGNIRGLYPGATAQAPRLFIGSHLDTVPDAGAFDGILGVILAIALVDSLGGHRFPFAIEVVGFSEEEGVRFGVPFIGSRALAGTVDDDLLGRVDADGQSVADAIRQFGLDPAAIGDARYAAPTLGYLEFHIEQGPVLDHLGLSLGIVHAIAGQTRADVTFTGTSGHAGTTPMPARADALAAAAEWVLIVEREAHATPGLVATVGRLQARPGAANVIAGHCVTSLDVRHADNTALAEAVARLQESVYQMATRRGVEVAWHTRLSQSPVPMTPSLVDTLARAVQRSGTPMLQMSSGAGHDAMVMAAHMPAAMVFLRSPGGISHHPDEAVREEDVAAALSVGRHFLDALAEERDAR
jgi:allantoate deiminase